LRVTAGSLRVIAGSRCGAIVGSRCA